MQSRSSRTDAMYLFQRELFDIFLRSFDDSIKQAINECSLRLHLSDLDVLRVFDKACELAFDAHNLPDDDDMKEADDPEEVFI